ncbi:MAG: protoporphyrinogen oxidase [Actinobacteria bacterium]|nr:protoporphyrinogen oxidase [Actinomycetota bacterium]
MARKVVVVGGGISGLVAAHRLATAGAEVTVVERSPRLGGKVVTEHSDGFLIEGGPDSFVAGKGSVIELADELGIANRVISSRPEHRGSHVWWGDRLHPLPGGLLLMVPSQLSPLLRSSLLSWKGKLRVLCDLALPRQRHGDESLESFVVRRLGREVLERIAEPLIAGIHAAEPSSMSLQASFPRFLEMEQKHRSLILAARAASSKPAADNGMSYFASFKAGMGELAAALVGAMDGVDIKTGVTVTRLTRDGDGGGYRLILDDGTVLRTAGVVLATPARETAGLLSELVPEAAAALSGIRQVATATVTLAYRVDEIPPLFGSGFVVPSVEGRRIMGVSYLSHKWEGRVPDQQFALLRAFVGGPKGQELAAAGKEQLTAAVLDELAALIGLTARPLLVRARSWEGGLHQYTLGHVDRVARAESALATHPGLALAGAAFHGIGLNECVESGRRAAASVLAARDAPPTSGASDHLSSRLWSSN